MSVWSRRQQRGYALSDAMVGGVVLMFTVGGVMGGFTQARALVSRALSDRVAAQLAVSQIEQLRALPYGHTTWTTGNNKPCTLTTADSGTTPRQLPQGWLCRIDVTTVTEPEVRSPNTSTGVLVVAAHSYQRARVTLTYRGQTWTMESMRW